MGFFSTSSGNSSSESLVRFIPFPVVGGFLAGTGLLIVQFSFSMMTDIDPTINNLPTFFTSEMLIRWVPGRVCGRIIVYIPLYQPLFTLAIVLKNWDRIVLYSRFFNGVLFLNWKAVAICWVRFQKKAFSQDCH
ncbi:MAG: hypothetical protein Ct9H300mP29_4520 [Candidatus Neomarinimicrobiota bacterium]|nr:MAG: hypothetical protein Ct9H300mP29_4520 [Candidatus Neomarinimicrobiota bacterium]